MKGQFTAKLPSFVIDNINICGQFFNKRPFKYKNIDKTFFKSFLNFVGKRRDGVNSFNVVRRLKRWSVFWSRPSGVIFIRKHWLSRFHPRIVTAGLFYNYKSENYYSNNTEILQLQYYKNYIKTLIQIQGKTGITGIIMVIMNSLVGIENWMKVNEFQPSINLTFESKINL